MARIAVLEFEQDRAAEPIHFISKDLAKAFLSYKHHGETVVEKISDCLLWIRIELSYRKLKSLVKQVFEVKSEPRAEHRPRVKYFGPMPRVEVGDTKFLDPKPARKTLPLRRSLLRDANAFGSRPSPALGSFIARAHSPR